MRARTVAAFSASVAFAVAACPGKTPVNPEKIIPDAAVVGGTADAAVTPPKQMTLADAGIVPEWMNAQANPCDDFFQYACGGFLASEEIPADRSSWGAIAIVDKRAQEFLREVLEGAAADAKGDPTLTKLGDYFAACTDLETIDAAGATPIQPLLDEVAKVKDGKTAAAAVVALQASAVSAVFGSYPIADFGDATQVILGLDQSGLGLPDRDYYVKTDAAIKATRAQYQAHVGRMLSLLGWNAKAIKAGVADVMRIETALAKLQQTKVQRRDPHALYHRIDRRGLEKAAKAFPWGSYLAALGIPDVTAITVHDPKYFTAITKLLGKEKPAAWRNYLTWMVLHHTASDLSKPFRDEAFAMEQVFSGAKEQPPRWRQCVEQVDSGLGELLGQSFVAAKFSAEAKQEAVDMTKAVFDTMDRQLDVLPWMDDATRVAAKQKLGKMIALIGYPDTWRSYDFEVRRDDFFGNLRGANRFEMTRQYGKIGKPVDRFDWQMTPPTVNAYYDPTLNEIALPAGQLQPPFFGGTFHPAVNFGSTGGGTIGHEMTHGFDDEGSQFDADGNLRDWWSKDTKAQFAEATSCVVDQFSEYEAINGLKLDGKLTAGENIADIGGVKLGFQAYQAWRDAEATPPPASVDGLSDDQLYFLAYAQSWCAKRTPESAEMRVHTDPHSPPEWRVNGVIVAQPGFGPAYACAAGTPMNPEDKCEVW